MVKVGFAQADMTPKVGLLVGSYARRAMTGVHDPLLASACVIDAGSSAVALVGVDAGVIDRDTAGKSRALVTQLTGIAEQNILIGASHTHTGGPVLSLFNGQSDPDYLAQIASAIASA